MGSPNGNSANQSSDYLGSQARQCDSMLERQLAPVGGKALFVLPTAPDVCGPPVQDNSFRRIRYRLHMHSQGGEANRVSELNRSDKRV
jgi:hypothetical protein